VSGQVVQVVGAITVDVLCVGTLAIINNALNDTDAAEAFHPGKAPSESPKQATKTKADVFRSQSARKE